MRIDELIEKYGTITISMVLIRLSEGRPTADSALIEKMAQDLEDALEAHVKERT